MFCWEREGWRQIKMSRGDNECDGIVRYVTTRRAKREKKEKL